MAARELNLHFLEKQCDLTLQYIQAIAEAKNVTLQHSVDHEDVAEIMLSLIDQEKRKYMKEGDEGNHADSESEEEEESASGEEDEKKEREDNVQGEKVQEEPAGEKDDENVESRKEKDSPSEKIVRTKKRKAVPVVVVEKPAGEREDKIVESQNEEDSEDEIVRPKKRRVPVLQESHSEESDEGSSESVRELQDQEQPPTRAKTPAVKRVKKSATESHHVDRMCVVGYGCSYVGPNLKRHLVNVHVKREQILPNQVGKYFAMGLQGHRKRGPTEKTKAGKEMKGRCKRWCPEPGCFYLGAYLPHHLQYKHRMKPNTSLYKTTLKIAVKYKGLTDEIKDMSLLASARWQRSRADETSQADETLQGCESDADIVAPTPAKTKGAKPRSFSVPVAPSATSTTVPSKPSSQPSKSSSNHVADPSRSTKQASSSQPVPGPSRSVLSDPDPSSCLTSEPSTKETSDNEISDEDESTYSMAADYFKEKDPKTNRHKWLVSFYRFLFTPTAGFKKEQNRLQHACQVKKLIEETDPKGDDILFMAEDEGNRVWVDWVVPNLQNKKPGTVKSYLTSLELFLEFVSKKGKRPHLPVMEMEDKNELFDLCNSLKKWRRCTTKETVSTKWDRYLDESDHLLTNAEVQDILSSKPAEDGRSALKAADAAEEISDLSIKQ